MEAWKKALEAAQKAAGDLPCEKTLSLNLDSLVKVPRVGPLPGYSQLQELSLSALGLTTLDDFPRLPLLKRLVLSDNRISSGLDHLVKAGLTSLTELDLSNNKIQDVEEIRYLVNFPLRSLDLFACPVTKVENYRANIFKMMNSLQYLDKEDADNNERPDSEEEEDVEEEDEYENEDDVGDDEEDELEIEEKVTPVNWKPVHELDADGEEDEEGDEDDEDGEEDEEEVEEDVNIAEDEDDDDNEEEEEAGVLTGHVTDSRPRQPKSGSQPGPSGQYFEAEDDDNGDDDDDDLDQDELNEGQEELDVEEGDGGYDGQDNDEDDDEDDFEDEEEEEGGAAELGVNNLPHGAGRRVQVPSMDSRLSSMADEFEDDDDDDDDDGEEEDDDVQVQGEGQAANALVRRGAPADIEDDEEDDDDDDEDDDGLDSEYPLQAGYAPAYTQQDQDEEDDEDDDDDEEHLDLPVEYGTEYLVQPIPDDEQDEVDYEPGEDDDEEDEEFDDKDDHDDVNGVQGFPIKRKRGVLSAVDEGLGAADQRPAKH